MAPIFGRDNPSKPSFQKTICSRESYHLEIAPMHSRSNSSKMPKGLSSNKERHSVVISMLECTVSRFLHLLRQLFWVRQTYCQCVLYIKMMHLYTPVVKAQSIEAILRQLQILKPNHVQHVDALRIDHNVLISRSDRRCRPKCRLVYSLEN